MKLYIGEKLAFARKNARRVQFALNNGVIWKNLEPTTWGNLEPWTWAFIAYKYAAGTTWITLKNKQWQSLKMRTWAEWANKHEQGE